MSSTSQDGASPSGPSAQTFKDWLDAQPSMAEQMAASFARLSSVMPTPSRPLPGLADALLTRLTEVPGFAHLWDSDRKVTAMMSAWTRLQLADASYRTLVAQAWSAAQPGAVASRVVTAEEWRSSVDKWLTELNGKLLELMRSGEYLAAQRQLLSAALELREQWRRFGDDLAELLQLPAREEVDDLTRSVAELRRQVRQLTRNVSPETPTVSPPRAPRRRIVR